MKICPYCGRMSKDSAMKCEKCKAGFPNEEPKQEIDKPVKVNRMTKRKNKE